MSQTADTSPADRQRAITELQRRLARMQRHLIQCWASGREMRRGNLVLRLAASGAEALARWSEGGRLEPIASISQIAMPGTVGSISLRDVEARRSRLPAIMVPAYGDEEWRRQARKNGAAGLVDTPVDLEPLEQWLQRRSTCSRHFGPGIVRDQLSTERRT